MNNHYNRAIISNHNKKKTLNLLQNLIRDLAYLILDIKKVFI